jgi:hypothetical protein
MFKINIHCMHNVVIAEKVKLSFLLISSQR